MNSPEPGGGEPKGVTKLRIESAGDLFRGLRSPDFQVRLAVLEAIGRNPAKALAYGPYEGKELADEIIGQLRRSRHKSGSLALFSTLAVFGGPRVGEEAARCFAEKDDPRLLLACANRLMQDNEAEAVDFLEPWIWRDDRPQARAAATILAGHGLEQPRTRLRAAILSDRPADVPPFDRESEAAWLSELNGAWRDKALELLGADGREAWLRLKSCWDRLTGSAKTGVVAWGVRDFPVEVRGLLAEVLEKEPELAGEILKVMAEMPELADGLECQLAPYAQSSDEELRLLAFRAGARPLDIRAELDREKNVGIRCLLLRRAAEQDMFDPTEILLRHLADPDWRIRSAAADGLAAAGPGVAGAVRGLLEHESEAVRATAAWILERIGSRGAPD